MSVRAFRVRSCNTARFLTAFAACVLLTTLAQLTTAQSEPSCEPILRIETGMHTGAIHQIGVDARNRFLVTASEDKTVRVWAFPSGRLLRTIRVPSGTGYDGRLYAVALSPDGMTIAAGGWTSPDGFNTNLYFFDRESGRLIKRMSGLPGLISRLVYSADGKYLAAMLAGKNGVRVYETTNYSAVGEDKDYGEQLYGAVDFDRADRLATACSDGFIRLYAPPEGNGTLRLLAKEKVPNGERASGVSFSPDGSRIGIAGRHCQEQTGPPANSSGEMKRP